MAPRATQHAWQATAFWATNGEIIAGLEPPESSIKAIDWITSVGAVPTLCVFRPLIGTDYADVPPPRTEDMVPIFRHLSSGAWSGVFRWAWLPTFT